MDLRGGTGSGCSPDAQKTLTGFKNWAVSEEKVELRVSLEDVGTLCYWPVQAVQETSVKTKMTFKDGQTC